MTSFRFPEFTPGSKTEGNREKAPGVDIEALVRAAREEGYNAGFVDGQAAATEAHLEDQSRLTSELIEVLRDAGMTNEAARLHVSASIAPLIEAIAIAIAPSLAEAGLPGEIGRRVRDAIEAAPKAKPRIRCARELAARLGRLLEESDLAAEIEEAPELLPREAQIFWDEGYDHLDLDACIARIREVISNNFSQDNGSMSDERRGYA
jgi:flagellar biosynthesis/type III secretory pathway protein FliH